VAVVLLALTGWNRNINLILLLAYWMLAVLLLNYGIARLRAGRVRAERSAVGPVFAGTAVPLDYEASHTGPEWVIGCWLVDAGGQHEAKWFLGKVEPNQPQRLRQAVTLAQRGAYSGQPTTIVCRLPFGLVEVRRAVGPGLEVIVLPRLGVVHADGLRRWLARLGRGDGRSHRLRRPSLNQGTDLHGLRPYRFGDSPRWIHWRTSARRNELMVRECEEVVEAGLAVIVEPWLPAQPTAAHREMLEATISLAASVCWEWCRHAGDKFALVLAMPTSHAISGTTGRVLAQRALETLALCQGRPDSPADELVPIVRAIPAGTPTVLFSSQPDSPLADMLTRQLGRPIVCPDVDDWQPFYTPPEGTECVVGGG
jgi:uncharacterized protein (DUF58 family)